MYALNLRLGRGVMIGDDIEVRIIGFKNRRGMEQVRVAIEAPDHLKIVRKDVYKLMKREQER